jgi:hypothetical protein
VQPFVIQSVAPIHAKTVVKRGGLLRSAALAAFVLALWCGGVALGPARLERRPRRRRPRLA